MRRIRITVNKLDDPTEELRRAARVRQDLYAHSPVEIDPDNRIHGTHRDESGRAYFEFATDFIDEVKRVAQQFGHESLVVISDAPEPKGEACANCGNITGDVIPTVCPTCKFRDISPCPHCNTEVSRQSYVQDAGDVFKCPVCRNRVSLRFNDPLFKADGTYNQPLVIVVEAT